MVSSSDVKETARNNGADLVGIATIEMFRQLPPEVNPTFIQPDARSVIVLGYSIPRGSFRGIEAGMAWGTFWCGMCNPAVECTYQTCRALESAGWEATPYFPQPRDLTNQGVRVRQGKPEPNVIFDLEYAAQAAGLGEIGRGKFFLTPEFGPRQLFTAILTDAELEPDQPFHGSVCDDCGACAAACPAQALAQNSIAEAKLCDSLARWYQLRIENCKVCQTGISGMPYSGGTEPYRVGAACGRACIAHLEDNGKLARAFHSHFREPAQEEAERC
ncbi:MAG TPA: hypothetical protein VHV83_05605 [Armatimonadota bacterium]|nr:hypothetical protein [Armatimonadota bacterium]